MKTSQKLAQVRYNDQTTLQKLISKVLVIWRHRCTVAQVLTKTVGCRCLTSVFCFLLQNSSLLTFLFPHCCNFIVIIVIQQSVISIWAAEEGNTAKWGKANV